MKRSLYSEPHISKPLGLRKVKYPLQPPRSCIQIMLELGIKHCISKDLSYFSYVSSLLRTNGNLQAYLGLLFPFPEIAVFLH